MRSGASKSLELAQFAFVAGGKHEARKGRHGGTLGTARYASSERFCAAINSRMPCPASATSASNSAA